MKFQSRRQSRRLIRCAMGTLILCLLGTPWARSQSAKTGTDQKPQMSEEAFKNIQVLRGIPVNEFMAAIGFFFPSFRNKLTERPISANGRHLDAHAHNPHPENNCT